MTIYPQGRYKDPLEQMIKRESVTCQGCIYQRTEQVFDKVIKICSKGTKHGKKCANYKEKE
jgi:hypothetical protein